MLRAYLAALLVLCGCAQQIPKEALQLSPESLASRQLQTRRFETADEKALLSAGAAVLQDLGFTIEASATEIGVIVASKDLSAVEGGQVAASIIIGLLTAALGAPVIIPWDEKQHVRTSFVTKRVGEGDGYLLARVTFQRIVWNTKKQVSKTEPLNDPKLYQDFFEKLSKAVFLDAHEL